MMKRFLLLLASVMAALTFGTVAMAQTPVIRDATSNWLSGEPRVLRAQIEPMRVRGGPTIIRVEAVFARHRWPGEDRAHRVVAKKALAPGVWEANPVSNAALKGDSLFVRWEVFYRQFEINASQTTRSVMSPQREITVGCTETETNIDLQRLQAMAQILRTSNPFRDLPLRGYAVPTHLNVSLRNIGFTMAKAEVATGASTVRFGLPDLAVYAPRRQRAVNETRREYVQSLTDAIPDLPYRLIGWAYAETHRNVNRRPSLGCVPSKHWFIHEAGFHLTNGGFLPTPPTVRETIRGESRVLTMADSQVARNLGITPGRPVWHPRIWDLHMWTDPSPGCGFASCLPLIQVASPAPIEGLPTPRLTFFVSQTFE